MTGPQLFIKLNYLGELLEVSGGYAVISTLYTAKYGVPAVGQRIFISSQ